MPDKSVQRVDTPGGANGQESFVLYHHADDTITTVSFDAGGRELSRVAGLPGGPAGPATSIAVVDTPSGPRIVHVGLDGTATTIQWDRSGHETGRHAGQPT